MKGLMQHWSLILPKILDHGALHHGEREVVTRTVEGPIVRTTYREMRGRVKKFANALKRLGVGKGDRIGTLASNTQRHMESWFAISGLGAVFHTVNPRLFAEQIVYILGHAEDKILLLDLTFVPMMEALAPKLPSIKHYIVLTDRANMPETRLPGALCYEDLLAGENDAFDWAKIDESDAAGLCYTSGTTGNPKGVLYSHRALVLHAMTAANVDMLGLRCADAVMPIVPMFHANAWCIPFVAPMQGAKLVLAGSRLDPESLCELFRTEAVTLAAGVPTIWLGFLAHLKEKGTPLPHLRRVLTGGAAPALSMIEAFERDLGIEVIQGWGMTEMSPMGTYSALKPGMETLPQTARAQIKIKQGRVPFGVEMTVRDEAGAEKPWDGKAFGHLKVRGCAVIAHYFREEQKQILDEEGWFDTGDIATIDAHGFMQITDRAKDVIKSGGEWISSIEIENLAMAHPDVAEAAVIGIAHPKWNERPLLVIVKKPGKNPDRAGILGFLDGRIAKWWMPDDVAFLAEMPHTATGKVQKTALREIFKDYVLPAA